MEIFELRCGFSIFFRNLILTQENYHSTNFFHDNSTHFVDIWHHFVHGVKVLMDSKISIFPYLSIGWLLLQAIRIHVLVFMENMGVRSLQGSGPPTQQKAEAPGGGDGVRACGAGGAINFNWARALSLELIVTLCHAHPAHRPRKYQEEKFTRNEAEVDDLRRGQDPLHKRSWQRWRWSGRASGGSTWIMQYVLFCYRIIFAIQLHFYYLFTFHFCDDVTLLLFIHLPLLRWRYTFIIYSPSTYAMTLHFYYLFTFHFCDDVTLLLFIHLPLLRWRYTFIIYSPSTFAMTLHFYDFSTLHFCDEAWLKQNPTSRRHKVTTLE
jgi:hypothetical protein